MKSKQKRLISVLLILIVFFIVGTLFTIKACFDLVHLNPEVSSAEQGEIQIPTLVPTEPIVIPTETTLPEPEHVVATATIGAMGDLLMHKPIFDDLTEYNAAVQQPDGSYDFTSVFQYLSEYTSSLDYAVANLETTLCGEDNGFPYDGYPLFNCPDELVDGAKAAGFDMLLTANNHSYDTRLVGYLRTLDVVRGKGLETLGTFASEDEIKWTIVDINGIKIGIRNRNCVPTAAIAMGRNMKSPIGNGGVNMDEIKIDSHFAVLKMIEILLQKGLINQPTYANIIRNDHSHISQAV